MVSRLPHTRASVFIDEFITYLETVDTVSANLFICGDFNHWLDDPNAASPIKLIEIMDSLNLVNTIAKATSVS